MRRSVVMLSLVAACHRGPRSVPEVANVSVRDDSARFLAFWQRARAEGDADRVARYHAEIVPSFPEYWDYVVGTTGDEAGADAALAKRLSAFEALEPRFEAAAKRAPGELATAIAAVRGKFPDFDPLVEIRLLHGLGRLDGGTRVLRGRYFLLFGLDRIAELHTWGNDRAFFVHELFHTYADQKHGRDGRNPHPIESLEEEKQARELPLFESLWEEGLATYVSEWALPGASHESMLLDVPKGMERACLANLAFLSADISAKLDSRDVADYGLYFGFRSQDARRPKRSGYCVGYLVAKKLHERRSMSELVALHGDALRSAILETLPTLPTLAEDAR